MIYSGHGKINRHTHKYAIKNVKDIKDYIIITTLRKKKSQSPQPFANNSVQKRNSSAASNSIK